MRCDRSSGNARRGRPPAQATPGQAAFTFAEVLAAMLFLAILIPVVVEGLTVANRASVVAERTTTALQLGENRLNELLLAEAWSLAETRGNFGTEWPGYRWELTQSNWEYDDLVQLSLDVVFEVQGREYRVRLATLVDDSQT